MGFWVTSMLIVYTLACCFLIFVILIQSGDKGGGLSSLGSSSQGLSDALGATGAEKTLNKMTTIAACLFIVLAVALSYILSGSLETSKSILPETAPVAPLAGSPSGAPGGSAASAPPQFEVKSNGGVEVTNPVTIPAVPAGEKLPANPVTAPPSAPASSASAAKAPEAPATTAPAPSAPAPAAK